MAAPEQAEKTVCYRHPRTETAVSCSSCGRPICTECMVFAAVGIKCPECAGQPVGARKTAARVRRSASEGTGAVATKILIGIAVAVYLLQIAQAGNGNGRGGWIWNNGYLVGAAVADGEWWRLVTAGFLHASPIHLLFNMLMLWWFGTALESLLGRVRFVGIYVVSTLAGSAGALLLTQPNEITVGASGAVFGILGAGLILERRQIMVFGGGAMAVVLFNLLLSFLIPGISIGGHLGGLAGGMVSVLALSDFGRGHAVYGRIGVVSLLGLAGTGIASILVAYLRVRGYS